MKSVESYPLVSAKSLFLYPEKGGDKAIRAIGFSEESVVGESDFDRRFHVVCSHTEGLKALLADPELKNRLTRLPDRGFLTLAFARGKIRVLYTPWIASTEQEIKTSAAEIAETLNALAQANERLYLQDGISKAHSSRARALVLFHQIVFPDGTGMKKWTLLPFTFFTVLVAMTFWHEPLHMLDAVVILQGSALILLRGALVKPDNQAA